MNTDTRIVSGRIFILTLITVLFYVNWFSKSASAQIELIPDDELANIDGQFSEIRIINHFQENDTIRIFLDIHQEIYGSIDAVRAGYYYKSADELKTTPIQIGLSGYDGYYHGAETINNGANFAFMKILSDFNTMAPANGATLEPWGNGSFDSSSEENMKKTLTRNHNNFDWDIWIENIQLGESPDKPQIINGMILRFEFDSNLYSTTDTPHLKRIIVGSNDIQGNTHYNVHRMTAAMNGLLISNSNNRSAGPKDPYQWTTGPIMIQRDTLVQCFGVTVQNIEDRDTGNFLIIDLSGDYMNFSIVAGYPENGTNFNVTGDDNTIGFAGVNLWDPSWAPNGNSGLSGSDPYNTHRQEAFEAGE